MSVHINDGVNNLYVYFFGPAVCQVVRILCLGYLKHSHINACTERSVLLINLLSLSLEYMGVSIHDVYYLPNSHIFIF